MEKYKYKLTQVSRKGITSNYILKCDGMNQCFRGYAYLTNKNDRIIIYSY
jgi:hypothetical protein